MHRFAWIAGYCGPQWIAIFELLVQKREEIKASIEEAAIWEGTNFTLNEALGTPQTFEIKPFTTRPPR